MEGNRESSYTSHLEKSKETRHWNNVNTGRETKVPWLQFFVGFFFWSQCEGSQLVYLGHQQHQCHWEATQDAHVIQMPFLSADVSYLKASFLYAPEICKSTPQGIFSLQPTHRNIYWLLDEIEQLRGILKLGDFAPLVEQSHWGLEDHNIRGSYLAPHPS